MSIQRILSTKGRDVATVPPHRTLEEAVRILSERRIGALVVTGADRKVVGIISERDIVRVVGEKGRGVLDEAVSAHMTRKVETARETETVDRLMERMTAGKFRHMPVVEDGYLCGIISIGDVVKHRLAEMEAETAAMRDYIATA